MKKLLFFLLLIVPGLVSAQKYMRVKLTPPSADSSCDASIEIKPYGLTPPFQIIITGENIPMAMSSGTILGYGTHLSGICPGTRLTIDLIDSNCVRVSSGLYIDTLAADQVQLDTINITMPTVSCTGSLAYHFNHLPAGITRYAGPLTSEGITTDSVFTGLCHDTYTYGIARSGYELFSVIIDMNVITPSPCNLFDANIVATTSPACDGAIEILPAPGTLSDYFYTIMYVDPSGYPYGMANTSTSDNFANDICPGPYVLHIEPVGTNHFFPVLKMFYADSLSPTPWNVPPYVPSYIDTLVLPAVLNCDIDYTIPIDTFYIANIVGIGGGQYTFDMVYVQGSDSVFIGQTAVMDTSVSFFVEMTVFCGDSSFMRSSTGFLASHNILFYRGSDDWTLTLPHNVALIPVQVYPNPADEKIFVNGPGILKQIQVISAAGKMIYNAQPNAQKAAIDVHSWPPAVYILRCVDDRGQTGFTRFTKM